MPNNLTTQNTVLASLPTAVPLATQQLDDTSHAGVSVIVDASGARAKMLAVDSAGKIGINSIPLATGAATEAGLNDIKAAVIALGLLVDGLEGKDYATQTTLAAVLAKLSADPATQTTLAAILTKLNASISVTGTFWQATQPVSGPLTDTQLRATAVAVSGTVATGGLTDTQLRATAVPVSMASAPTGAATATKQDDAKTVLDNILLAVDTLEALTGIVTETAPTTDTASSGLNGRLQRIAQRLTSLIALLPSSIGQKAKTGSLSVTLASDQDSVPVTGTFWQATQPVSAASLPLPTGATTETTLAAIKAKTDNLDVALSTRTKPADTQPISAASLPLPALAATSTKQSDGSQKTQVVDGTGNVIGATANALDVNIKSGASAGTEYVEDAAAAADPAGGMLIARRKDTLSAAEVSADGDNIALNSTSKGQLHVKLADTVIVDGSAVTQPVSLASAVPVTDNSGTLTVDAPVATPVFVRLSDGSAAIATLPVSAASLPLPSGAATSAKQPALGTAGTASADVISIQGIASMTALKVDGSAVTQPVSGPLTDAQIRATALPVSGPLTDTQLRATAVPVSVTGVATEATLDARTGSLTETAPATDTASSGINGRLQRVAQRVTSLIGLFPTSLGGQTAANSFPVVLSSDGPFVTATGSVTETAPATDTASSGLNGRLQRIAQRITSMIALLPTSLGANGGLKIEGVASGTVVPISAASLPLPALAATSTKQSDGTQKTQVVDGSGNVIGATSNALDVNIKSGSSAGTEYTEDAVAAANPVGGMLIARRKDTLSAAEVSADGDNIALNSTSKGQLHTASEAQASEAHVGEVGGKTVTVGVEITRPADTTAYAALDSLNTSTSAPTSITFAGMSRIASGSGYITKARIVTDQSSNVAQMRLWLFNAAPNTLNNDNAAFLIKYADKLTCIGYIDFPPCTTEAGSDCAQALVPDLRLPFTADSSSQLLGVYQTRTAFTPASAQKFYTVLVAEQN